MRATTALSHAARHPRYAVGLRRATSSSGPASAIPAGAIGSSGLIGLCAVVVYAALAAPHIVAADNAELATLGALGGAAHPPGYPLYVLWLRAWAWLPMAPAHAAAIATAILAGAAIGVLHAACRAWGARPLPAALAVAIVGASPLVVQYATEAEVFAGDGLIAALVLLLAAEQGPLRGAKRGAALGLVGGLGIVVHLSCALLAPIGVLGVVRAARESRPTTYALAIVGFVVGLSPNAYLFLADGPASWGTVSTLGELWAVVSRREYGGTNLVPGGPAVSWTTNIAALAASLGRAWLWLGALAGVAALVGRIARADANARHDTRGGWAMLAASFALVGPFFVARFNIEPRGIGLAITERFYLLPTIVLTVPVASALDAALPDARSRRWLVAPAAAFLALLAIGMPRLSRVHGPAVERGVAQMLATLPPDALAVVVSEDLCLGARYLQLTQRARPDVGLICSPLLQRDWYRAAWLRRGLALPMLPGPALRVATLATGRPVFVERGLVPSFDGASYPFGVLHRVLPRGTAPPSASDVAIANRELFSSLDLDYPRPHRDDGFAAAMHRRYAAAWAAVSELAHASGDPEGARDAYDVARSLQPAQD